jgi:EAL domain-containing protein (putative c-di-GMP-specific phosphodiesterase class I)
MPPSRERIAAVLASGEGMEIDFQPIARLADLATVGYEALARFRSPLRQRIATEAPELLDSSGLGVAPNLWFAEAGLFGMGAPLETMAVRLALDCLPALPADRYLSVNASAATCVDPLLLSELARHDLARVVLEVTEHDEAADYEALLAALEPLRRNNGLSLRIAVDDVGAGASMGHLLALRPDVVKIDRSVVAGLHHDAARRALVRGFVGFGAAIDASVVAEGIESDAEVRTLRHLLVSHGQGYHLGRPGPLP